MLKNFIHLVSLFTLINIGTFSYAQTLYGPDSFNVIEEGQSGFNANLDMADRFSRDHDSAGDINGDGITDMVVGARSDDDGATDAGAVYILFMNQDGTNHFGMPVSGGIYFANLELGTHSVTRKMILLK